MKTRIFWQMLCASLVAACLTGVPANAEQADQEDKTLSPYFLIKTEGAATAQLPLLFTAADVKIAGVIADVIVTQVYQNEGASAIEAVYVFPGSTRAAVYGLTMTLGDRTIVAEIQEKQQARRNYEQAKQEGKTASLLEQQRPNVFQMNVANILPGDLITVTLKYTELLVPADGVYEFVYPTVVGPRYSNQPAAPGGNADVSATDAWVQSPFLLPDDEPPYLFDIRTHLATGIPVQEVTCATHAVTIESVNPSSVSITLDSAGIRENIRQRSPEQQERLKQAMLEVYGEPDSPNLPGLYQAVLETETEGDAGVETPQSNFGGDRDYVLRYRLAGGKIASGLLLYAGENAGQMTNSEDADQMPALQENFFLLMVQPPERVDVADIPPREYIFIVDVSGSMNGFPLNISKTLLRDVIGNLRSTDTFNVLLFAGDSEVLSSRSLPATPQNIDKAVRLIDKQAGGGATELLPALKRALALPRSENVSRNVVIVTDGYVTVELEAFELIRAHLDRMNVFSFGIGSSVNRYLIEGLARAGQGEAFVVTESSQAKSQAGQFREYIQAPVLTQIAVDFDGFEAYDVEPVSIPDVLAECPVLVYGKWRGAPHGTLTVRGSSGQGAFAQTFEVGTVTPNAANAALRYLWARKRIEVLGDYNSLAPSDERVRAITNLGLTYSLLTQYTSFVAIDHIIRRDPDDPLKTIKQPVPLPQGVPATAVGGGMRSMPEPGAPVLLFIAAVLVAFVLRPQSSATRKRASKSEHPENVL